MPEIDKNELEKFYQKQLLIRNQFETVGKYGMPLIRRQEIDLDKIDLWAYLKAKLGDEENAGKTLHFFHP